MKRPNGVYSDDYNTNDYRRTANNKEYEYSNERGGPKIFNPMSTDIDSSLKLGFQVGKQ